MGKLSTFWQALVEKAHEDQSDEDYQRSVRFGQIGDLISRELFKNLLHFCEFAGVMALLFAIEPHAKGTDLALVKGLKWFLWMALWLYAINVFAPKEPGPRKLVGWFTWQIGARSFSRS